MSCGPTPASASQALKEAVELYLVTSAEVGTLAEVLEESGYKPQGQRGSAPPGSHSKGNPSLWESRMARMKPVHWRTLERVFLAGGFRFVRQQGSHRSYVKPGIARPIVIPTYDEIPVSIIRNNLKTAGISRDEYFSLLDQVR